MASSAASPTSAPADAAGLDAPLPPPPPPDDHAHHSATSFLSLEDDKSSPTWDTSHDSMRRFRAALTTFSSSANAARPYSAAGSAQSRSSSSPPPPPPPAKAIPPATRPREVPPAAASEEQPPRSRRAGGTDSDAASSARRNTRGSRLGAQMKARLVQLQNAHPPPSAGQSPYREEGREEQEGEGREEEAGAESHVETSGSSGIRSVLRPATSDADAAHGQISAQHDLITIGAKSASTGPDGTMRAKPSSTTTSPAKPGTVAALAAKWGGGNGGGAATASHVNSSAMPSPPSGRGAHMGSNTATAAPSASSLARSRGESLIAAMGIDTFPSRSPSSSTGSPRASASPGSAPLPQGSFSTLPSEAPSFQALKAKLRSSSTSSRGSGLAGDQQATSPSLPDSPSGRAVTPQTPLEWRGAAAEFGARPPGMGASPLRKSSSQGDLLNLMNLSDSSSGTYAAGAEIGVARVASHDGRDARRPSRDAPWTTSAAAQAADAAAASDVGMAATTPTRSLPQPRVGRLSRLQYHRESRAGWDVALRNFAGASGSPGTAPASQTGPLSPSTEATWQAPGPGGPTSHVTDAREQVQAPAGAQDGPRSASSAFASAPAMEWERSSASVASTSTSARGETASTTHAARSSSRATTASSSKGYESGGTFGGEVAARGSVMYSPELVSPTGSLAGRPTNLAQSPTSASTPSSASKRMSATPRELLLPTLRNSVHLGGPGGSLSGGGGGAAGSTATVGRQRSSMGAQELLNGVQLEEHDEQRLGLEGLNGRERRALGARLGLGEATAMDGAGDGAHDGLDGSEPRPDRRMHDHAPTELRETHAASMVAEPARPPSHAPARDSSVLLTAQRDAARLQAADRNGASYAGWSTLSQEARGLPSSPTAQTGTASMQPDVVVRSEADTIWPSDQANGEPGSIDGGATTRAQRPGPRARLTDAEILVMGSAPGAPLDLSQLADRGGAAPLSSKSVLTIALQKAQSAVQLDGSNNVPEAIAAYRGAVRLLEEVMERITPRGGTARRSKSGREEERRRLRVIHDTYADRIRLLSMIYSPDEDRDAADTEGQEAVGTAAANSGPRQSEQQQAHAPGRISRRYSREWQGVHEGGPRASSRPTSADQPVSPAEGGKSMSNRHLSHLIAHEGRKLAQGAEVRDSVGLGTRNAADPPARIWRSAASLGEHSRSNSDTSFRSAGGMASSAMPSPAVRPSSTSGRAVESNSLGVPRPSGADSAITTPTTPYFDAAQGPASEEEAHRQPPPEALQGETRPRSRPLPADHARSQSTALLGGDPVGVPQAHRRAQSLHARRLDERQIGEAPLVSPSMLAAVATATGPEDAQRTPGATRARSPSAAAAPSPHDAGGKALISTSTSAGTISQRRKQTNEGRMGARSSTDVSTLDRPAAIGINDAVAPDTTNAANEEATRERCVVDEQQASMGPRAHPPTAAKSSALWSSDSARNRKRASSQPGSRRPSIPAAFLPSSWLSHSSSSSGSHQAAPPVPKINRKPSFPSMATTATFDQSLQPIGTPPLNETVRNTGAVARNGLGVGVEARSQLSPFRFPSPAPSTSSGYHALAASTGVSPGASTPAALEYGGARTPLERRLPSELDLFPGGLHSCVDGSAASYAMGAGSRGVGTGPMPAKWLPGLHAVPVDAATLPPPSSNVALRPYQMMRQLHISIARGAYLTSTIFVAREMWASQGAKLAALDVKVRVLELVIGSIEGVEKSGEPLLAPAERPTSPPPTNQPTALAGMGVAHAAHFAKQLEDLEALLVEAQNQLAKKLGFIDLVAGKKASSGFGSFGSKLTRSFDKVSITGKQNDSPYAYVEALMRLFRSSQVIGKHLQAVCKARLVQEQQQPTSAAPPFSPGAQTYAALPAPLRDSIEAKLRRATDFFANVVLRFVLRDVAVLVEKTIKRGPALLVDS